MVPVMPAAVFITVIAVDIMPITATLGEVGNEL